MTDLRDAFYVGHQNHRLGQAHLGRFSQRSMAAANHNRRLSSILGCYFSSAVRVNFNWRLSRLPVYSSGAVRMNSTGVCLGFRFHSSSAVSHRIRLALSETQRCQRLSVAPPPAPLHRIQPAFPGALGVLFPAPFTLASTGVSPRSWRYTPSATPLRFSSAGRGLMDRLTK